MTPGQWAAVRDLFEQALDRPDASVDAWLEAQPADADVVREVRALLAAHSRAGAFLDAPLTSRVPDLLEDDARFASGDRVGPYLVAREIGRGGMGRVYLATDTRLGRKVALKVLAPHLVRDEAQRERLRREARAAASLNHAAICTVYALDEIDSDVVLASEFVDGETLRADIDRAVRPSAREVQTLAASLATALEAAHARGITHRDLKPENVMRAQDGAVKVLDFGLALVESDASTSDSPRMTTPGMLVGTPAYMAPEQIDRGPIGPATDLFALGVLLYEYATGVHPFASATPLALAARILDGTHVPLAERRADLPAPLVSAIERCLATRQTDRFSSASALLQALHEPEPTSLTGAADATSVAASWWKTHERTVLALYVIAIGASWVVREWEQGFVDALFVVVALLAVAGGVFRSHLLFTYGVLDRRAFLLALRRSRLPVSTIDLALGFALALQGVVAASTRAVPGVLIVGLAAGLVLARFVLERSTTEAAFGEP